MGYGGWDEPTRGSKPEKDEDFEYEKQRQARIDAPDLLLEEGATKCCNQLMSRLRTPSTLLTE